MTIIIIPNIIIMIIAIIINMTYFMVNSDIPAPARLGYRSPSDGPLHLLPLGVFGGHPAFEQNQHE